MSQEQITALVQAVIAISTALGVIASVLVSWQNNRKITQTRNIVEQSQATGEAIHTLVNGGRGGLLLERAAALRRVAVLTDDEGDRNRAQVAETTYREHRAAMEAAQDATAHAAGAPDPIRKAS